MNIYERFNYLKKAFSFGKQNRLEGAPTEIVFMDFLQTYYDKQITDIQSSFRKSLVSSISDDSINENMAFQYPIFKIADDKKSDSAILLLHGLNERSWEKYLCWAEALTIRTGKPVILFPIAFHVNRTPTEWINPRIVRDYLPVRRKELNSPGNLTFANITLSDRITEYPLRFYISGKETAYNLKQLFYEIKSGRHPLFKENTQIDIFAYSIGALLSQVLLLSNPDGMFDDSKLFMFCGGSLFNRMNGNSKFIMDETAFTGIKNYYQNEFLTSTPELSDSVDIAFKSMIDEEVLKTYREVFFNCYSKKIKAISLKKDTVIPTAGIKAALGAECANECLTELDFPFAYSHEVPFPVTGNIPQEDLNRSFDSIFTPAAEFLA
ncbi:MAG: DUF6051 family protein [Bacteroidales bacterium]|nr:DUF6051 family protein [Bacteroidales bacterium]